MKFYFSIFLFFCSAFNLFAQNNTLALDENGKFIYFEVVSLKAPKDSLKTRLANFLKQQKNLRYKKTQPDTVFNAVGKLVITKSLLMLAHPSGEISYSLQAEVKDEKYRFWFTDFNFIPYQKDRYGNFVPSTSVGTPFEHTPSKQEKEQWAEYKLLLLKHLNEMATQIKLYMANAHFSNTKPAEKTIIKTW